MCVLMLRLVKRWNRCTISAPLPLAKLIELFICLNHHPLFVSESVRLLRTAAGCRIFWLLSVLAPPWQKRN